MPDYLTIATNVAYVILNCERLRIDPIEPRKLKRVARSRGNTTHECRKRIGKSRDRARPRTWSVCGSCYRRWERFKCDARLAGAPIELVLLQSDDLETCKKRATGVPLTPRLLAWANAVADAHEDRCAEILGAVVLDADGDPLLNVLKRVGGPLFTRLRQALRSLGVSTKAEEHAIRRLTDHSFGYAWLNSHPARTTLAPVAHAYLLEQGWDLREPRPWPSPLPGAAAAPGRGRKAPEPPTGPETPSEGSQGL